MKRLSIHEPYLRGNEKKYLIDCLNSSWVSTSGKYLSLFENKIKKITKSKYVVPVLNGTIAIHISLILSGVNESDEVIVPSITFIGSINPVKYVGANPIFMDVDNHLNLDQEKCIEFLKKQTIFKNNFCFNKKTKKKISALIIVHTFGNAAKFEKLFQICKKMNIKIIEDAAESLGTYYKQSIFKKKHTGTIGDFGIISFNGNKITTSGNGGAILLKSKFFYKKCKYLVNQAKDDKVKFIHNEIGYNYGLSNISAAIGLAQLEKLNFFLKKKKKINDLYKKKFSRYTNFKILDGPGYSENNNWINLLEIKKNVNLNRVKTIFDKHNIQFRPVWLPNHLQKMFKSSQKYRLFNSQKIYKKYFCLPSSVNLRKDQINKVCEIIIQNFK